MITVTKEYQTAKVVLFRGSGRYYTEEYWEIPDDAISPHAMKESVDFRRVDHGAVLIPSQEPWGYPHLINAEPNVEMRNGW